MPCIRKEIPKGGSHCFGGAGRLVEIKALEGHVAFIRLLKRMYLMIKCVSMVGLFIPKSIIP